MNFINKIILNKYFQYIFLFRKYVFEAKTNYYNLSMYILKNTDETLPTYIRKPIFIFNEKFYSEQSGNRFLLKYNTHPISYLADEILIQGKIIEEEKNKSKIFITIRIPFQIYFINLTLLILSLFWIKYKFFGTKNSFENNFITRSFFELFIEYGLFILILLFIKIIKSFFSFKKTLHKFQNFFPEEFEVRKLDSNKS